MIEAENLLERAEHLGRRFRERLEALKERCPLVQEVRVKGAMIGVELTVEGAPYVQKYLERRLLINCTHGTTLRLLPALTLTDEQLDEGCDILERVMSDE
jgi:acetylornithine/succinyldiaminopimelate/putrescine aminotransferase